MSQFTSIDVSCAELTTQGPTANRNLLIAVTLSTVAIALISVQLIFASNHLDALDAAARTAALGIIAP